VEDPGYPPPVPFLLRWQPVLLRADFFRAVLASVLAACAAPAARETLHLRVGPGDGALVEVQLRVRQALAEAPARDVVVRLGGGTYRLDAPLIFGEADGSRTARVVWEAAPGERVVLSGAVARRDWMVEGSARSGGVPARGPWYLETGEGRIRRLLVRGEPRALARWPETGWLRVQAPDPDGRRGFEFTPGEIPPGVRPGASELVFLHDWSSSRVAVQTIEHGRIRVRDPIGAWHPFFHITGFEPHPRFALENAPWAWDRPGEWYHDVESSRLGYRPLPGETPETTVAEIPGVERLLTIRGSSGGPVHNLVFRGLTFTGTRSGSSPRGYAGIQAAFGEARVDGVEAGPEKELPVPCAVRARHAESLLFESCTFEGLGGSGLWLGQGTHGARILGCRFRGLGANGIMIGELEEPGAGSAGELSSDITVEDNLVEDCGQLHPGAVGVWIGLARGILVRHNELRSLPYTGISLGWIWGDRESASSGHRIERNHIHHVVELLADGGGIYTIGRHPDTLLRANLIHDVARSPGRAPNNGFFLDQGSTDLVVEGNLVHSLAGSPIRFHMAGSNRILGNTLVPSPGGSPYRYDACTADGKVFEGNRVLEGRAGLDLASRSLRAGRRPHPSR